MHICPHDIKDADDDYSIFLGAAFMSNANGSKAKGADARSDGRMTGYGQLSIKQSLTVSILPGNTDYASSILISLGQELIVPSSQLPFGSGDDISRDSSPDLKARSSHPFSKQEDRILPVVALALGKMLVCWLHLDDNSDQIYHHGVCS